MTSTTRAAPRQITSSAAGTGTRTAMPSAIVFAVAVSIGARAANDCAYALALVDTTPTISVDSPSASRALIRPQMPEPQPMGT